MARVKTFKQIITTFIESKGKKLTNSSRGISHVRFPLDGNFKDYNEFFEDINSTVTEASISISATFDTYIVTNKLGETVYWVNNAVGIHLNVQKIFNSKELTPKELGIVGIDLNTKSIIDLVSKVVKLRYTPPVANELIYLMNLAKTKSKNIKLDHTTIFNKKDRGSVSKDFGEVLSGIWIQSNLNFPSIMFPPASNEKLIDFYGNRLHIPYPVSVKSKGGGKVTIQNILDAINNREKTSNIDLSKEKSLSVFNTVRENTTKEGMLKLNQLMVTDGIKSLSNIMQLDYNEISIGLLRSFLNEYTNDELKDVLHPLHNKLNTKLKDESWDKPDKMRFVISPLGEDIWKILNKSNEIKNSLINVARQVAVLQVNIDLYLNSLIFKCNYFKDSDFIFGWAGYSAGNKLGFSMEAKQ